MIGGKAVAKVLPISKARPDKAEQPGPPVSQSMRGSSFGLFSDSMNFSKTCGNNSGVRLPDSRIYGLQGGHRKKWTRRPITTNTEGSGSTKSRSTKHEILNETVLTSSTVNVNKTQLGQFQEIQYCDIEQEIAQNKDLCSLVTVIVFDIETTGFSRENERIIEIALRDLQGGENSTFQTLVNPQRSVPNSDIHGITTQMVCQPDVPRMKDLIPILLHYVRSREKPGGYVLFVGHNARCFDVPFIINELRRHSIKMPPNWLFVDTLPLARELIKSEGRKPASTSLAALRELYGVEVDGSAHRAMVDVNTLSMILPRLTFDLKLTLSDLVKKSFTESDIINSKKKKNSKVS
ncbi:Ribonuclease H-like superfamily [Sesbania bispinosa]|nr:Ribonuclease H-like superfamily [Sesbania bispinosa]